MTMSMTMVVLFLGWDTDNNWRRFMGGHPDMDRCGWAQPRHADGERGRWRYVCTRDVNVTSWNAHMNWSCRRRRRRAMAMSMSIMSMGFTIMTMLIVSTATVHRHPLVIMPMPMTMPMATAF